MKPDLRLALVRRPTIFDLHYGDFDGNDLGGLHSRSTLWVAMRLKMRLRTPECSCPESSMLELATRTTPILQFHGDNVAGCSRDDK